MLQPAEVLLDLYGEDIRARAFVTRDDEAEMMLRPDFTVPIVQLHMDGGAEPAAYSYCGPVWRRPTAGSGRPREYLQAGIELFGGADPAEREAEVLLRILAALGPAPVDLVTGDMGLVLAAVDSLATTPARRAALRRHVWRPGRFQVMLARYGREQAAVTAGREGILGAEAAGRVPELIASAGAAVGLRAAEEVAARIARLAEEARTPPLDPGAVVALEALLALRAARPGRSRRCGTSPATSADSIVRSTGWNAGWRSSRRAAFRLARSASRRASGAPRSNITMASSLARSPAGGPTCRRSRAAGAMTR